MSRAHDPVSSSSVIQRKSWPGHSDDTFGTHSCRTHRAHNCTSGWATSRTPALSPESSQNEQARWDAINEAYLGAGFGLLALFTGQVIFDGNLVQSTDGRQFGSRPVNPISRSNKGASSATGTGAQTILDFRRDSARRLPARTQMQPEQFPVHRNSPGHWQQRCPSRER